VRQLRLRSDAEAEAASAVDWYEAEQPGLGAQFLIELDATLGLVESDPLAYERVVGSARRALVRRFPYAVYFTCDDEAIEVFAILHQHRGGFPSPTRARE
jgi:plasmid stabilization system protein ParE